MYQKYMDELLRNEELSGFMPWYFTDSNFSVYRFLQITQVKKTQTFSLGVSHTRNTC